MVPDQTGSPSESGAEAGPGLLRAAELATVAGSVATGSALWTRLWPALRDVIDFDLVGWGPVAVRSTRVAPLLRAPAFRRVPPGHLAEAAVDAGWRWYGSAATGDGVPTVSMFAEVATLVEAGSETAFGMAVTRFRAGFPDRDLAVLNLLRPHLAGALLRSGRLTGTSVLTARERQAVVLVARGHTDEAIAHRLGVSRRTVNKHLEHAYRKLGVHDRTSAAVILGAGVLGADGVLPSSVEGERVVGDPVQRGAGDQHPRDGRTDHRR